MLTVEQLTSATPEQLLAGYAAVLRELRSREIVRTNNAPAGDYAEWLAQRALGGVLAPNSVKSYDLTLDDGTRVQVKARVVGHPILNSQRQMSPFRSWDFGLGALVQLSSVDYSVLRATLVPTSEIRSRATYRSHVSGDVAFMTDDLLGAPGARDVTAAFRAAAQDGPRAPDSERLKHV
ncbi:hypothetical protein [Aeromicrobium sp. Leaf291]|uniref:hypothetical protein n=1 Tax=Aeromicrobium sp. Leaf291 TaxID=1736325 RepID=UPI0006FEC8DB|nr:hypothetical protein [Aeromicrobium sp. Leaf291]KQP82156.1 hypothetical protein ASF35_11975 [Aeromicrobium sp. Leaf291]